MLWFDRVMIGYVVDVERCIRCGACAILAPGVFEVVKKVKLVRQPATAAEAAACEAAALVCPARAIEGSSGARVLDPAAGAPS